MKKIKNIAAMGFSLRYPENTMLAYERAFAAGADLVEVDARFTKDRIVVLSHDDSIDRTTDGIGRLDAYTYEELRVFDAAGHFRSGAAFKPGGLGSRGFEHFSFTPVSDLQAGIDLPFSRIPRLEDLLALLKINGGAAIIEIKSRKDAEAGIGAAICALIRQYGLEDRCYVSSFDHEYIHAKCQGARYSICGHVHWPTARCRPIRKGAGRIDAAKQLPADRRYNEDDPVLRTAWHRIVRLVPKKNGYGAV